MPSYDTNQTIQLLHWSYTFVNLWKLVINDETNDHFIIFGVVTKIIQRSRPSGMTLVKMFENGWFNICRIEAKWYFI